MFTLNSCLIECCQDVFYVVSDRENQNKSKITLLMQNVAVIWLTQAFVHNKEWLNLKCAVSVNADIKFVFS